MSKSLIFYFGQKIRFLWQGIPRIVALFETVGVTEVFSVKVPRYNCYVAETEAFTNAPYTYIVRRV